MPIEAIQKKVRRARRKIGLRKRINGTAERPRLSVFRSLKFIYAQLIDDIGGRTIAEASDRVGKGATVTGAKVTGATGTGATGTGATGNGKTTSAKSVGSILAERAKKVGVTKVVFDRNGYLYHGRVKALADGAREGGLQF